MREKLIELVGQVQDCGCDVTDVVEMNYVENITLVDHLIANGVTVQEWISVKDRLPEERNSIFAKYYGTERWTPLMFRKISDEVLAVVEYEDGTRKVKTIHTTDGEWRFTNLYGAKKVTDWMPLPQPPKGE